MVQSDPMPQDFSFDIVCKVNLQEVDNAINQAMKEITTRFDFKGSISRIDRAELIVTLLADDEFKLRAVTDILITKLAKRGVPRHSLNFDGKIEAAISGSVRQTATLQQGIPSDRAKEIVKIIKDARLKVQPSIQGDQVRVTGRVKDDLQAALAAVRAANLPIPIDFVNYR